MEFKYFEFKKKIITSLSLSLSLSVHSLLKYSLKMFYNVRRQYMPHSLARIVADENTCRRKISSRRQYMLYGDNMCLEYRHIVCRFRNGHNLCRYSRHQLTPQRIYIVTRMKFLSSATIRAKACRIYCRPTLLNVLTR